MSQSLSQQRTPLKQAYDTCFNSWFEGYLEPAVSASSSTKACAEPSKKKAEDFEERYGSLIDLVFRKAVKDKGPDKLLQQAREENL